MKRPYHLNYLNFSGELHYLKKDTDIEDVQYILNTFHKFQYKSQFFHDHLFFLIDYRKRKYITMAGSVKGISGFHPMDFLHGGLEFVVDIFQKDDFQLFNNSIWPATFNFFQQHPNSNEHPDYVFEFNYRMRNKNGKIFTALQKCSYLTDPLTNLPLFSFGTCQDISDYKKDSSITRSVFKFNREKNKNLRELVSKDYFYPDPLEAVISKREKEILKWMAEGLSSKQLADKFNLSQNTIMNHRKNMLRKTNAKNVAELIKFAIVHHLI